MAETFSTRLWPALSDEELAAASSASLVTTTSTVTTHQQRLLLPSTSSAQLSDLSAFLASSASTSAPSASQQTLLDDLLRDEEQPHLLQSHDNAAVSTAMTDVGVLSDAAFFSLGEESQRGEQTYSSSASGSPSTGTSNLRLLQLETNYERKKKRAKINRKDLNSRFQELMDILHLKEDRKLNRAKILEKTIEHIEKLTAELKALKAGHQPQHTSGRTSVALHRPPQLHAMTSAMAHSMGQHSIASSAHGAATGGAPLLPYNPAHTHPWGPAAVGTSLPLASMMWVPCPVVTSSGMVLKRAAPGRSADTASRKRGRVESVESVSTTISEPVSSASETDSAPEAAQVRAASSAANESSLLEWSAQEIPTLLAYCDAWTLVAVMKTSRELRRASQRRTLWEDLCRVRWRLPPTVSVAEPFEQWQEWHRRNRIPDYTTFTRGGVLFASGREEDVSVWGLLSHRSNGHTTRTVLLNGKATVMQVVELLVVVQNLSRSRVRVTDCISLTSKPSAPGDDKLSFQPFTAASGAHLTPQIVGFNSEPCATKDFAGVFLQHGDLCVLSVYMACPGLELEDQFLQRAGSLNVECLMDSRDNDLTRLNVCAGCKDHNDYDRTHEKAMLALHQSG